MGLVHHKIPWRAAPAARRFSADLDALLVAKSLCARSGARRSRPTGAGAGRAAEEVKALKEAAGWCP